MPRPTMSLLLLVTLFITLAQSISAGGTSQPFMDETTETAVRRTSASVERTGWERLQALPVGTELRLSLEGVRTIRGKLVTATEDTLTLRASKKSTLTVSKSEVIRVHAVRRDSITNGLLLGLAIGCGAGGIWGGVAGSHEDLRAAFTVPLGLAIGAGLGTAIGAVADGARLEYQLIYERPSSEPNPMNPVSDSS